MDVKYDKISDRYTGGISDILACVGGLYVAIELKADGKTASADQKLFIKDVRAVGGIGGVCFTLGEVKALVEEARTRLKKN